MSHLIQAAVVEAFGKPSSARDGFEPSVGSGLEVVDSETRGVCRTARGDAPVKPVPPSIPDQRHIGIVDFGAAA